MPQALKLLFIGESGTDAIIAELQRGNYLPVVERATSLEELDKALASNPDIAISDFSVGAGFGALDALRVIQERVLDLPLIVVSGKIRDADVLAALTTGLDGADPATLHDKAVQTLKHCHRHGVFGLPYFVVGRERFWGVDRLPFALREAGLPWRGVEFHAALGSTNTRLRELLLGTAPPTGPYAARGGAPEGCRWWVVLTDHQTGGRGRLDRVWQVPDRASVAVSCAVPVAPPPALTRARTPRAGRRAPWPRGSLRGP